eukprot:gb/GEZN01010936.1/.p1 GENE.gb/GEZN01010936.1/~~gb/GEZN01010936.1/.p1  ORF type:complete len:382 (-),score=80.65 gb/GEZN01010936.1/:53-1159(-)
MAAQFTMNGHGAGVVVGEENIYQVLGAAQGATQQEMERHFRQQARKHHPDKNNAGGAVTSPGKWDQIAQAKEIATDPVRKLLYDMEKGVIQDNAANHQKLHAMKKMQAEVDQSLMEREVEEVRERERERRGLIILEAKYGLLDPDPQDPEGPFIDVTVPVQCKVEDAKLELQQGSKFWLEGFYDPTAGKAERMLDFYVRYEFLGRNHEVVYDDEEEVRIPLQGHLVIEEDVPEPVPLAAHDTFSESFPAVHPAAVPPPSANVPFSSPEQHNRLNARKAQPLPASRPLQPNRIIAAGSLKSTQAVRKSGKSRLVVVTFLGVFVAGGYVYYYHKDEATRKLTTFSTWLQTLLEQARNHESTKYLLSFVPA